LFEVTAVSGIGNVYARDWDDARPEPDGNWVAITATWGPDGGQFINIAALNNNGGQWSADDGSAPHLGISGIKVWRMPTALFPPPPVQFWTQFVGAHEVV
jgi:hypothetical protein